jgi:hypothetical protein
LEGEEMEGVMEEQRVIEEQFRSRGALPLSELVESVTDELHQAQREAVKRQKGRGETPIMRFKECQLEMGVEVTTSVSGEVSVWVFTLGGGYERTTTNTVSVTFEGIPENYMTFIEQFPQD